MSSVVCWVGQRVVIPVGDCTGAHFWVGGCEEGEVSSDTYVMGFDFSDGAFHFYVILAAQLCLCLATRIDSHLDEWCDKRRIANRRVII